ncbi:hypothetical protein, partial [Parasutterella muris]|uniref:hypothetical protein n=1 Tax=Parasutterella muris TaxID=2565572 RepID=UPI00203EB4D8
MDFQLALPSALKSCEQLFGRFCFAKPDLKPSAFGLRRCPRPGFALRLVVNAANCEKLCTFHARTLASELA